MVVQEHEKTAYHSQLLIRASGQAKRKKSRRFQEPAFESKNICSTGGTGAMSLGEGVRIIWK